MNGKWCETRADVGALSFISDLKVSICWDHTITRYSWDRLYLPAHLGGTGRVQFSAGCWTKPSAPAGCWLKATVCSWPRSPITASVRGEGVTTSQLARVVFAASLGRDGPSLFAVLCSLQVAIWSSHTTWHEHLERGHLQVGGTDPATSSEDRS